MAISVKKEERKKLLEHQALDQQALDQQASGEEEDSQVAAVSKGDVLETHANHENDAEFISVAEMEIIVPGVAQRMRMPCERATYLSREHSDMIIICLAVIFLLVVVVLETFPQRYVIR